MSEGHDDGTAMLEAAGAETVDTHVAGDAEARTYTEGSRGGGASKAAQIAANLDGKAPQSGGKSGSRPVATTTQYVDDMGATSIKKSPTLEDKLINRLGAMSMDALLWYFAFPAILANTASAVVSMTQ